MSKTLFPILLSSMSILPTAMVLAQTDQPTVEEEVVVIGIRGAQQAAIDVKRDAAAIVDSIVAEDIGKLPDVTIADALQRISGVQIERTAGEGARVNIRGMPQVLTALNGEQFLSPWSITDVQANYSDIPASMIAGVNVYKSQSARMPAGGISGIIDLQTFAPRDMPAGWTGTGSVEVSQGSITDDPNFSLNGFLGWNGERFGATLGMFSSTTNSANYRMDEYSRLAFPNAGGDPYDLDQDGDMTTDRYLVPEDFGVHAMVMERERQGLAGSIAFDFTDALTLQVDAFYTKMDQYDRGVEAVFNGQNQNSYDVLRLGTITQEEATVPLSNGTPPRTLNSVQLAVVEAPDFQATTRSKQDFTDALNTNVELHFDDGGPLRGSLRYVHADASKLHEEAAFQQGTPEWYWVDEDQDGMDDPVEPFDVVVDYRPEYPTFSFTDDLSSADRLNLFQAFAEGQDDNAGLDVARADATYDFEFAGFTSVDFGLRHGRREVESEHFIYMTPTGYYSTWADPSVPEDLRFQPLPGDFRWQRYPDWVDFAGNADLGLEPFDDLRGELQSYSDFGPFQGWGSGVAALDPESLDDLHGFMNRVYPGADRFAEPSKDYRVVEAEQSAYVQLNFDTQLRGMTVNGNIGGRYIKTDREVDKAVYDLSAEPAAGTYYGGGAKAAITGSPEGWQVVYKSLGSETTKVGFSDFLPAINVNFLPREDVVLRLAYNKTVSRNNLQNVGEGVTLWHQEYRVYYAEGEEVPEGAQEDEQGPYRLISGAGGGNDQGNPNIQPWRADNYNASAEWYFSDGGLLAAGLFLIEVNSATQTLQEQRSYPDSDGVVRRNVNIWVTENVPASNLKGFELSYRQQYDFLPGIWSNTGMELNYTYSDNDSGSVDFAGNSFPLQGNSKHQANAILWYQGARLSSRLAYNWRSEIFQGRVGLNTNEAPISLGDWTEAAGYLDASVNYDITGNLTAYLQGTNLTETNQRRYAQFTSQFNRLEVQERRLLLGLRARF